MVCSIEGCGKKHKARGFCVAHYERLKRHGDPLGGRTGTGEAEKFFKTVVLSHSGEECLFWPYARMKSGYGRVTFDGVQHNAHRLVCIISNGEPPSSGHEASHTCGNGDKGCVNPGHLVWETPKENTARRMMHGKVPRGTGHRLSKLTESIVEDIRRSPPNVSCSALAKKYDVSRSAVELARNYTSWRHV